MSAVSARSPALGQSHDATVLVDFVLQMTLPELTQRREMLQEVLERTHRAHREQMISSPLHHAWEQSQADVAYLKHSISLLERAMLYAPKSHDAQRALMRSCMEAAHG